MTANAATPALKPAVAAWRLGAVCVVIRNPFLPVEAKDARRIELPASLSEIAMREIVANPGAPITANLNGEWLLRKDWGRKLEPGDVLVLCHETQGGGGSNPLRVILQLAASAAIAYMLGPEGAGLKGLQFGAATVAANLAVSAVLNNLIPAATLSGGSGAAPSPTYNFALSGNQAAQDEPIEVQYGYVRAYPRFAAQPYAEFADNDQYYKALLTIGQGRYAVKRIEIDDTPLSHFADVTASIVEPGAALTLVEANVVTAPEVSGQELKCDATLGGQYVGGFAACGPRSTVAALGFDIVLNGLGHADDDGDFDDASVTVRFESREIDDFGAHVSSWSTLATETITAATSSPVRKSFKYTLATPKRVEVRAVRTDPKSDSLRVLNTVTWSGLRAYLAQPAALADTATYLEVSIRASEQLNGLSQRKIAVAAIRMLQSWSPGGGWSDYAESRSIAWAIADVLRNATYGKALADSRIDLQTLYTLDQVWQSRQDRFDYRFESASTAEQAINVIAKAGRAVCFQRGGIWSVMRDQAQTLPVAMYTPRNVLKGSFQIEDRLPTSETPDAVNLRYFSNRSWSYEVIQCPAPGYSVADPGDPRYDAGLPPVTNPQLVTIEGICGARQAEREGLYIAADTFYRRRLVSWECELDAQLAAYGSLVLVAHDMPRWGQFGDVVDWDPATLALTLSEPPQWDIGTAYIRMHRPDGSVHPAIMVAPGAQSDQVILAAAPDFTPIFDDAGKDRTRYVIGIASDAAKACRMLGISDRGGNRFAMRAVAEDDRVHAIDNHLLPGLSEVQDPIDSEYENIDDGGGGTLNIVTLTDHFISAGALADSEATIGLVAEFILGNDGRASAYTQYGVPADPSGWTPTGTTTFYYDGAPEPFRPEPGIHEWLNSTVGPASAALWEVRFTAGGPDNDLLTGETLDTWLGLGTSRSVRAELADVVQPPDGFRANPYVRVRVEIREAASGIVQVSRVVTLVCVNTSFGGGGGP